MQDGGKASLPCVRPTPSRIQSLHGASVYPVDLPFATREHAQSVHGAERAPCLEEESGRSYLATIARVADSKVSEAATADDSYEKMFMHTTYLQFYQRYLLLLVVLFFGEMPAPDRHFQKW